MKAHSLVLLLPFLLFACKKENNEIDQGTITPPFASDTSCQLYQESFTSASDSNTKTVFATYIYDIEQLVLIDQTLSQNGDPEPDTAVMIYWENDHPVFSMRKENAQLDTLEKYTYDMLGRLTEVSFYNNGNVFRSQKMIYGDGSLRAFIYESNGIRDEFEVRTENGLIMEIIQSSRNGNQVDSNYLRQIMMYDDQTNPHYNLHTGNFNRLEYFNKNNIVEYRLIRNGVVDQTQSIDYLYEYDNFGNPLKLTTLFSGLSYSTYSNYICQ